MSSVPICLYVKALTDDDALTELAKKAILVIKKVDECKCEPKCRELTAIEKGTLMGMVVKRVQQIRESRNKAAEGGITIEQMCSHIAHSIKETSGENVTITDIFNMSPVRDIAYYLEMYENSVFSIGYDFFHRPAPEYFEERVKETEKDPQMADLCNRYKKFILTLEGG